jgi:hypothetical protein
MREEIIIAGSGRRPCEDRQNNGEENPGREPRQARAPWQFSANVRHPRHIFLPE